MMTPSRGPGSDAPLSGEELPISTTPPSDSGGTSKRKVAFAPSDWVRSAAAGVSSVTGRLASATADTLRRPMNFARTGPKQRSAVNPLAMAATTAEVQTRHMLSEERGTVGATHHYVCN